MTVERPVEIELKYAVVDRAIGERLLNADTLAGFRAIGPAHASQYEDRYVDSAGGALARAGFAARLRTSAAGTIATVKSTTSTGDGALHRREELEGPADRTAEPMTWPPSPARSLILELVGDAPLVELVTIRQFRRRRDLVSPLDEAAVELSLDEVDVVSRGRVVERFLELELEMKRGPASDLAPLRALLDGNHGLTAAPGSKLERALIAARGIVAVSPAPTDEIEVEPEGKAAVVTPPEGAAQTAPEGSAQPRPQFEAATTEAAALPTTGEAATTEAEITAAPIDIDVAGGATGPVLASGFESISEAGAPVGEVGEDQAAALEILVDTGDARTPTAAETAVISSEDGPVEGTVVDLEALVDVPELIEEAAAAEPLVVGPRPAVVSEAIEGIPVGKTPGVTAEDLHAEAGRKVFRFHLARMIDREPGTREGSDPEELHAMRVSTRRMRAAWRVFGDGFRPERTRRYRRRLRLIAGRLGLVRDLDVLIQATEAFAETLPTSERGGLEPLLDAWRDQREAGRALLMRELDSAGHRRFIAEYRDFVLTPGADVAAVTPTSPHRVRDTAPSRIWLAYEQVRAFESVLRWADVPTLHQLRIASKRLRYTLEFVRDALGPEAPALISRVVAIQDHLGAMNDAEVAGHMARAFLVERAGDLTDAQTSAISRYLVAREREVARLKRTVGVPWRGVAGLTFRRALGRTVAAL